MLRFPHTIGRCVTNGNHHSSKVWSVKQFIENWNLSSCSLKQIQNYLVKSRDRFQLLSSCSLKQIQNYLVKSRDRFQLLSSTPLANYIEFSWAIFIGTFSCFLTNWKVGFITSDIKYFVNKHKTDVELKPYKSIIYTFVWPQVSVNIDGFVLSLARYYCFNIWSKTLTATRLILKTALGIYVFLGFYGYQNILYKLKFLNLNWPTLDLK